MKSENHVTFLRNCPLRASALGKGAGAGWKEAGAGGSWEGSWSMEAGSGGRKLEVGGKKLEEGSWSWGIIDGSGLRTMPIALPWTSAVAH